MIPDFDDSGLLPAGVHPASLDEIENRFGRQSELRRVQMESMRWMMDLARRAGAVRVILDGSFTTDTVEPNDVDCVMLFPPGTPEDIEAFRKLRAGLPFVDLAIIRSASRFEEYVREIFATDRFATPKGMIEVTS